MRSSTDQTVRQNNINTSYLETKYLILKIDICEISSLQDAQQAMKYFVCKIISKITTPKAIILLLQTTDYRNHHASFEFDRTIQTSPNK